MGLSNACIFRLLDHPERDYGRVRMFGTVGWVAASGCLTLWFCFDASRSATDYSDSLRLGGSFAFLLALYAWTLPHTPPQRTPNPVGTERSPLARLLDAPLSALMLFRYRSFVIYCICMFGMNVTLPFTVQLNPLLLERLDVPSDRMALLLTIAQSTEIVFLFLLPLLLKRFGLKPVMVVGGMSWTLGLSLLSIGEPVGLALASLMTHGVFICCFLVAGQVFVNRLATHDIRASAQGVLLLISGSGLLLGHQLVGGLRNYSQDNYGAAYFVAACIAGGMVSVFLIGFAGASRVSNYEESLVANPEIP
jgi:Na+/melibiose symporter-like transporter